MAIQKKWQYQQYAKPVPTPGGEVETSYFAAWNQPQNEPRRNYSVARIARAVLIAAAPVFFFQEVPAAAFTTQLPDPIVQRQNAPNRRTHCYQYVFFQEAPAASFTGQPFDAISHPQFSKKNTVARAPYLFFPERAIPTEENQPFLAVSQPQFPVNRKPHLAPYLFFPERSIPTEEQQPFNAVSQPQFPLKRKPHLAPYLFFPDRAIPTEEKQAFDSVSQPVRRAPRNPNAGPYYFAPETTPVSAFTTQIPDQTFQPRARVASRVHLYPTIFEVVSTAAEASHVDAWGLPSAERPPKKSIHASQIPGFFFQEQIAAAAFDTQISDPTGTPTRLVPSRIHLYPTHFAPVSTDAETIYFGAWQQPIERPRNPVRNFAFFSPSFFPPETTPAAPLEASIIGTIQGTRTLSAGLLTIGKKVKIESSGYYSTAGSPGTLNLKIKFGTTEVVVTGAQTLPASVTNRFWKIDAFFVCRGIGVSGSIIGESAFEHMETASGIGTPTWWEMTTVSPVTIDTTIAQEVDLRAAYGSSVVGNSIYCTNFNLDVSN